MKLLIFICVAFAVVGSSWSETCLEKKARVEANPMPGAEIPFCEEDGTGSYSAVQNRGSMAICVTPEGERIPGYGVNRWEKEDMHCECARQEHEHKTSDMVGQTFSCNDRGNFEAVQCVGSQCGCHDTHGQPTPDKPWVPIWKQHELNCDEEQDTRTCQAHAAEVNARPMPGRPVPICEEDGTYSPKQYRGATAICVTKENKRIPEYRANRGEEEGMHCECARQQYEFQQTGMVGRFFSCDERGNFQPVQCQGTGCSCHDSHGHPIPGSPRAKIWEQDKLNCEVVPSI